MAAPVAIDGDSAVLDDAWGHVSQSRDISTGLGSFTRQRIERIIALAAGMGSLALGAQAFFSALGPSDERPGWHLWLMIATFVPLAAMIVACVIGRAVRVTAGTFAILYIGALALWPLATAGTVPVSQGEPWIWYLVNIATLAAVLAFSVPLQIIWTVGAPLLFGVVRLIQGGLNGDYRALILDVAFALILGSILLTLGWLFRSVAENVDETRGRAVASYANAAAADAAESERIAVAALMHDSVLAALISAERAESPREHTLAVAMAREALTRLANAERDSGEGSDVPRPATAVADEIENDAGDMGVDLRVSRHILEGTPDVPGRVARALVLASTQAIANAIQHAEGRGLRVDVAGAADPAGVRIVVSDTGGGFDLERVPEDRLGIRASIVARIAAVGGTAKVVSDSHGTTITLQWEHRQV